jgi:carbon-monoxide dehydrogenase small subunit
MAGDNAPSLGLSPLELNVNGDMVRAAVPSSRTLLEFLRYDLGLTGSKQGCDKGDCGACTVILNGKAVLSCITLALEAEGTRVETVESLAKGTTLHPLQDAFVRYGAAQCGFCTPGILMSAKVLLDETAGRENDANVPTRTAIQHALSGNLCRCTGYTKIVEAVEDAARTLVGAAPARSGKAER